MYKIRTQGEGLDVGSLQEEEKQGRGCEGSSQEQFLPTVMELRQGFHDVFRFK